MTCLGRTSFNLFRPARRRTSRAFQPGARSAWHSHPTGQRLVVTEGTGRTQQWGEAVQELRAGDVVWSPV